MRRPVTQIIARDPAHIAMMEQITIAIADDHALVRQGIRTFLEVYPDFSIIGEADSGEAMVRLIAESVPDIVLMDLVMAGIGGVEATRQVKRASPHTEVIHRHIAPGCVF